MMNDTLKLTRTSMKYLLAHFAFFTYSLSGVSVHIIFTNAKKILGFYLCIISIAVVEMDGAFSWPPDDVWEV